METLSFSELRDEAFIAKKLHCEIKTLQAWRTSGKGPRFVKVGRLVRYRQEDVQAWIESRLVASTSSPRPAA